MRGDAALFGAAAAAVLAVPLAVILVSGAQVGAPEAVSSSAALPALTVSVPASASAAASAPEESESAAAEATAGLAFFRVLKDGAVAEVSALDYVRGVLAEEMPADYETEALKAQAVAAYTISVYEAQRQRASPDASLLGADFSVGEGSPQGYLTEAEAKEKYGDGFDYAWARLTEAARYGVGHLLVYDGEPILAAYHAISAGRTEDSGEVWDVRLPYLVSEDSAWDILAAGYRSSVVRTEKEVRALLEGAGASLSGKFSDWIEILERSEAGYVTRVRVGDLILTGTKFRSLMGLRSTCFTVVWTGSAVTFEVKGYGHGAGLSQNGADYMARQGGSCEEILAHYYPGTTLQAAG